MNYLSEMLRLPVLDVNGEKLGIVNDFGIATGEVFPHVTSLAFQGPGKTPFMISWRKYVDHVDDSGVYLNCPDTDIRFSYPQPDEVLLARDILNKQIVDTQGMKVVRVNDIKFSVSGETGCSSACSVPRWAPAACCARFTPRSSTASNASRRRSASRSAKTSSPGPIWTCSSAPRRTSKLFRLP